MEPHDGSRVRTLVHEDVVARPGRELEDVVAQPSAASWRLNDVAVLRL